MIWDNFMKMFIINIHPYARKPQCPCTYHRQFYLRLYCFGKQFMFHSFHQEQDVQWQKVKQTWSVLCSLCTDKEGSEFTYEHEIALS